jgi:hypothetical protein
VHAPSLSSSLTISIAESGAKLSRIWDYTSFLTSLPDPEGHLAAVEAVDMGDMPIGYRLG